MTNAFGQVQISRTFWDGLNILCLMNQMSYGHFGQDQMSANLLQKLFSLAKMT